MTETVNPVGRPRKFQSVEEMQAAIDAFFAECDVTGDPYTITGLALALDTTRKSLIDYENIQEFSHTIKTAKARVEHYAEKKLFGSNATGPIFALKNFGWSDKQEHEMFGRDGAPLNPAPDLALLSPGTLIELLTISQQLASAGAESAEEPGDAKT